MEKIVMDHKGVQYRSRQEMCEKYGVNFFTFLGRRKYGYTLEKALTATSYERKTVCNDHLGHEYPGVNAMCKAYGISASTFCYRRKRGYTLQQALTHGKLRQEQVEALESYTKTPVMDHKGVQYRSQKEMCKMYGVYTSTFRRRRKRGYTLEEALTGKNNRFVCKDHKGISYRSQQEMCEKYGVNRQAFLQRRKYGYTLEKALTATSYERKTVCNDHLGHEYPGVNAMCKAYGISATTFRYRMKHGYTLQQALTLGSLLREKDINHTATPHERRSVCNDHLGREYPTIKAMCKAYGISATTFRYRMKHGYTLQQALTLGSLLREKDINHTATLYERRSVCKDYLGREYPTIKAMCKAYGISVTTFRYRMKHGYTLQQALTLGSLLREKDINHTATLHERRSVCKDYLGREYPTIKAMCKAYGISVTIFRYRMKHGYTLQQALTRGDLRQGIVTDHHGNTFCSVLEMVEFYHVNLITYYKRLARGLSQAEALKSYTKTPVIDHKGVQYRSQQEMCKKYGVNLHTFLHRRKRGYTIEKALTSTPYESRTVWKDHLGQEYPTIKAMCDAYGVTQSAFYYRMKRGDSLQQTLTHGGLRQEIVTDHKGVQYRSQREMCEEYGVNLATFRTRRKNGCTLQQALTSYRLSHKRGTENPEPVMDHKGISYRSLQEMCEKYGVKRQTFLQRREYGYTLEKALTATPYEHRTVCKDHLGQEYPSVKAMCDAYGISAPAFRYRMKQGYTLQQALTSYRLSHKRGTENPEPVMDHKGVSYRTQQEMCEKYGVKRKTFLHRRKYGDTLEKALTATPYERRTVCKDHLGQEYPTIKAMCNAYGISASAFRYRMKQGYTLQQALTPGSLRKTRN